MRVVVRRYVGVQRPAMEDVVPSKRDKQRMLDIVIARVAVSDVFQRKPGSA